VAITKTSAGPFRLDIYGVDSAGTPIDQQLLATTTVTTPVPFGNATVNGAFHERPILVAGHQYALAISQPGAPSYEVRDRSGNPCPGREFFSGPTGSFAPGDPNFDFVYTIHVGGVDFEIGKLKGRRLPVTVPVPGAVLVEDLETAESAPAPPPRKQVLLRTSSTTAAVAGTVKARVKLVKSAARRLSSKGRLKLRVAVVFIPTDGAPFTKFQKFILKSRNRRR
jgi:hypothetical protein